MFFFFLTLIFESCRNSFLTSVYQEKIRITLAVEAWIVRAARLASLTILSLWRVSTNARHTPLPWVSSWNTCHVSTKEEKRSGKQRLARRWWIHSPCTPWLPCAHNRCLRPQRRSKSSWILSQAAQWLWLGRCHWAWSWRKWDTGACHLSRDSWPCSSSKTHTHNMFCSSNFSEFFSNLIQKIMFFVSLNIWIELTRGMKSGPKNLASILAATDEEPPMIRGRNWAPDNITGHQKIARLAPSITSFPSISPNYFTLLLLT